MYRKDLIRRNQNFQNQVKEMRTIRVKLSTDER